MTSFSTTDAPARPRPARQGEAESSARAGHERDLAVRSNIWVDMGLTPSLFPFLPPVSAPGCTGSGRRPHSLFPEGPVGASRVGAFRIDQDVLPGPCRCHAAMIARWPKTCRTGQPLARWNGTGGRGTIRLVSNAQEARRTAWTKRRCTCPTIDDDDRRHFFPAGYPEGRDRPDRDTRFRRGGQGYFGFEGSPWRPRSGRMSATPSRWKSRT